MWESLRIEPVPPTPWLQYKRVRLSEVGGVGELLQRGRATAVGADQVLVVSFDEATTFMDSDRESLLAFVSSFRQRRTNPEERYLLVESQDGAIQVEIDRLLASRQLVCAHRSIGEDSHELLGARPAYYDRILAAFLRDPWVFAAQDLVKSLQLAKGTIENHLRDMFTDHGIIARRPRDRTLTDEPLSIRRSVGRALGSRLEYFALWRPDDT